MSLNRCVFGPGVWPFRVVTGYVSFMLAIFMVRSMKRVIFQEARGSSEYLHLALLQPDSVMPATIEYL